MQRRAALGLEVLGQLGAAGRLAGALEPGHQHDGGRPGRHRQAHVGAAHQRGQLLVDDLDDLLVRGQRGHDLRPGGPLLDRPGELLDHGQADVGLEQGQADGPHGLVDVALAEPSPALEAGERSLQLVGQRVEHATGKGTTRGSAPRGRHDAGEIGQTGARMPGRPDTLRFGAFMAPYHAVGEGPTLALERDLELIVRLDELGFDEAWVGEHHSTGWETIASPEIFLAVAAERTRHIRLGTGAVSLPYHHPLMVADRIVLLDHLTRGPRHVRRGAGRPHHRRAHARHRAHSAAADDGRGARGDRAAHDRHRPPDGGVGLVPAARRRAAAAALPAPAPAARRDQPGVAGRDGPGRPPRGGRPVAGRDHHPGRAGGPGRPVGRDRGGGRGGRDRRRAAPTGACACPSTSPRRGSGRSTRRARAPRASCSTTCRARPAGRRRCPARPSGSSTRWSSAGAGWSARPTTARPPSSGCRSGPAASARCSSGPTSGRPARPRCAATSCWRAR